ncbi:hypothetical protein CC1G_02266 [Coprinopsis cinerea okayama7|uniref:DUF6533 domain-containing protein n=1 Tax=Coprinopsis cinerea (strain Okayama-7 / 130 / ATCC MYA-4618 / FGSC 9003) TaxID=240176 RepID=A8N7K9_COPC7|nr:hypothetical protein CC1G_02266 [Coprinopsis cinerea okayama7\|eukprot:XP_001830815.2 hypothetical protein CC1G_02266 [Coprinopsis cinerea okayama7\
MEDWVLVYSTGLHYVKLYDYFLTFGEEVSKIWHSRLSLGKVLFLLSRYTAFVDQPINLLLLFGHDLTPKFCGIIGNFMTALTFVGVCASEGRLSLAQSLVAVLTETLLSDTAAVIELPSRRIKEKQDSSISVLRTVPPTFPGSVCEFYHPPQLDGLLCCYYILIAGEFCITIAGLTVGLREYRHARSRLMISLYQDGTLYFVTLLGGYNFPNVCIGWFSPLPVFSTLNISAPYIFPPYLGRIHSVSR